MGSSPKHLTPRQIERLKSELAEVIIANFCYPSFYDYRLDLLRTRPVDRRKRQEVWAYINSLPFGPLTPEDANTVEFRRFVERVFLRYIEINRGLIGAISARRVAVARSRVPQLAADLIKELGDFLTVGDSSTFGLARPVESWGSVRGKPEPTWEQIERSTQLLQTTLIYLHTNAAKEGEQAGQPARPAQAAPPVRPSPAAPSTPSPGLAAPPAQPAQGIPAAQTPAALTPPVSVVSPATPAAPQREDKEKEAAPMSVSSLPTQLLPPRPAHSVSRPVLGSRGNSREYETVPLEFPSSAAPIPRRQFSPLSHPRSVSRPVQPPASAPGETPAEQRVDVASLETIRYSPPAAGAPASTSRSQPAGPHPAPLGQAPASASSAQPAVPLTSSAAPVIPSAMPPVGVSPVPLAREGTPGTPLVPPAAGQGISAGAEAEDETWLSILSETSGEHMLSGQNQAAAPARAGSAGPQSDSGVVLAGGASSPVGPYGADLPDLPEAFPVPELTNLPPDLAELYGDYLRDSRSGVIGQAAVSAAKEPTAAAPGADQPAVSSAAPLPETARMVSPVQTPAPAHVAGTSYLVAPEKAEVDALIAALADHLVEQPAPPPQEAPQRNGAQTIPPTLHPFQLRDAIAQAKAMGPAGGGSVPSGPFPPAQPARLETAERAPGTAAPVQPAAPAAPQTEIPAQLAGTPALFAAPATVPLAPKITDGLPPLPASEQNASAEALAGTNASSVTSSSAAAPDEAEKEMTEADVLIFVQLQHQVSTWVKIAAVSHQIEITGQDVPELVAELRRMAALEEAELQVIESLVALCQRVTTTRQATMEDYKQAMMLYLLHHRSRLAL